MSGRVRVSPIVLAVFALGSAIPGRKQAAEKIIFGPKSFTSAAEAALIRKDIRHSYVNYIAVRPRVRRFDLLLAVAPAQDAAASSLGETCAVGLCPCRRLRPRSNRCRRAFSSARRAAYRGIQCARATRREIRRIGSQKYSRCLAVGLSRRVAP